MIEKQLEETKNFLNGRTKLRPALGFVLGSGLSGFAKRVKADVEIPFSSIPGFTGSTVEGHPGKLVFGELEGVPVAVQLGRLHAYEGLSYQQVIFPIRTMAAIGVKTVVMTNAAGGLSKKMKAGDFMVIRDQINLTGDNPLRGPNLPIGPRFVDMSKPFDRNLSKLLLQSLKEEKARAHQGVYIGVLGPTYETPAEVKFFAKIGGNSVGMSTVAEVIAARHAGLRVVGMSCITNLASGLSKNNLTHEEVKEAAAKAEDAFTRTLVRFTRKVKSELTLGRPPRVLS